MDSQYVILGANGFLGSYLKSYFETVHKLDFKALYRPQFDIRDIGTYDEIPRDKQLFIIDAITINNGNKTEIYQVNIQGQKKFIDWLNSNNISYHYIYFSTLSTLKISEHLDNDYIVSKFKAENYLKENAENYTIIRVSFLFGKGENKNRLLSRLINNIQLGQDIQIDNVLLNLTPVSELGIIFKDNDFLKRREINFVDGVTYRLQDLVSNIAAKLKPSKSKIDFTDKKVDLTFNQNFFTNGYTFKVPEAIEQMIDGL